MKTRLASIALLLVPAAALGDNYLLNPGFEDWHANVDGAYGETYSGQSMFALATGAVDWTMVNQNYGTTTTARRPPPAGLQGAGNWSIYVTTDTEGNGIGQETENNFFQPVTYDSVSGWVYLTGGSVGIGWFDQIHQQLNIVASTSTMNQWVYLSANLPAVQSSGFEILGLLPDSSFYADNMDADSQPLPEPASLLALGLGALALRRRKRG